MLIKDIFADDVTRDIAPVIYFHEQDPERVDREVSEYIITGGYPETDPRHQRIPRGIHEQFVKVLKGIAEEIARQGGADLPACWISGFYGSGKSSFAKLLGLALDGLVLPGGRTLADALLARDDSPRAAELRDAWHELRSRVDPLAVVFDIGSVARDDEDVPSAAKRQIQERLGYCARSHFVAEHELKLELEGHWQDFLKTAREELGRPWEEAKHGQLAEDDFSRVMYKLFPGHYTDPMSWFDSRAGTHTGIGTSVDETTRAVANMLDQRAPGKTLFVVVDEVSQYIHHNESRQLKLQSFVSDLGKRLKGRVWLLATGQQQLEDTDDAANIGKLKDRFPEKLRVHLEPANIRDVVHKRLLRKDPRHEDTLRELFQRYRNDLTLYGYVRESITAADFLEVYPLLPDHVDLLMQITSNLRLRSTRIKGDDYAIRGLLQLLGELFRQVRLGERKLGALVTLDDVYEIQHTALDADTQNSMTRLLGHEEVAGDETARRVAKAVALLGQIQEQQPTTSELVARCLYDRLGRDNPEPEVKRALERLKQLGLLAYSGKHGYKIQSSAGQEWQRERDARHVTPDEVSDVVAGKLKDLLGTVDRPRYKGKSFPWAAFYSDDRQRQDDKLLRTTEYAVATVDFRYPGTNKEKRAGHIWVQASDSTLKDRLVWIAGLPGELKGLAAELVRSRHMVKRYEARLQSLAAEKKRLFFEEQSRREDDLEPRVADAVAQVFLSGEIYFRGRAIDKARRGNTFATLLLRIAEDVLQDLYKDFVEVAAVTPSELEQLLAPQITGPSPKLMPEGLGILELDAGKYVATCRGEVPSRISHYVREQNGCSGQALLAHFGGPPYGYGDDMVKAALAGLLRGGFVRLRPESGPEITSYRDPGAQDVFKRDRDLKRADVLPPSEGGIGYRERVSIAAFFADHLRQEIERENEAIAGAVFDNFPAKAKELQELERRYDRLPGRPELPEELRLLRQALEVCTRSRQVEDIVHAVHRNLDKLGDGLQMLGMELSELTDEAIDAVGEASGVHQHHAAQLQALDALGDAQDAADEIENQLTTRRPWRGITGVAGAVVEVKTAYRQTRRELLERQERRAEEIRQRLRQRHGFSRLDADQSFHVLRPIEEALIDTTPEAVHPTLGELRDGVELRLARAEEEAERRLDHALSAVTDTEVVPLRLDLKGREISSEAELDDFLARLRERILERLADGRGKIRIRLIP